MAVRVRKLAREVSRSSEEIIGVLRMLGYPKYRSANDMVADAPARKARDAVKQGLKARVAPVERAAVTPVVTTVAPVPERAESSVQAGVLAPVVESDVRVAVLQSQLSVVSADLTRVNAELDCVRADRSLLVKQAGQRNLGDALADRGLTATTEAASAISSLAGTGWGASALSLFPGGDLQQLLIDRVVLTPDAYPLIHGCVTVQVEPYRAEVPPFQDLVAELRQLSDALMLAGLLRVCGVGVPPRWHALIREHTDQRVALVLLPGGTRHRRMAVNDCSNGDVIWSWEQPSAAAVEAYSNGARVWCWARPSGPSDLSAALRALCLALQGSQQ